MMMTGTTSVYDGGEDREWKDPASLLLRRDRLKDDPKEDLRLARGALF